MGGKTDSGEQEKIVILDSLMEHVVYHDREMKILWANRAACESVRMQREDLLGRHCYEVWAGLQGPCEDCPIIKAYEIGQPQTVEKMTPDGRWWHIQVHPVRDSRGCFAGATAITLDITERKRAAETVSRAKEELEIKVAERTAELNAANHKLRQEIEVRKKMEQALRESRQRYQNIFENAPIGFYRTASDGRILDANPVLLEILGYASFKDLSAVNLETGDYQPVYPRRLFQERIERDGQIRGLESFWKRPDNTLVYIRENARAIRDADGRVVCYEGTVEDISDQKRAAEHIHMLSRQLMQAQEGERQMLSRELHDTVAQDLSAAKMACDLIHADLSQDRASEAQRVTEVIGLLQKTINDVRNMAYELRPPGLEEVGLVETVYQFCEDFTHMWGVPVDFQSAGLKNVKLSHDIQINLYRLVQEGLTNIRKHAAAGLATVKLAAAFPNIIIRIEDDGRGFDVQQRAAANTHEKRMGLRSMQERVKLMHGEMKLQSKPGRGTKVAIKVPLEEEKGRDQENHLDR